MSKPEILNDIDIPYYMNDVLETDSYKLTYWGKFKRKTKFSMHEKLACVFEGTEEFRLVSFQNSKAVQVAGYDRKTKEYKADRDLFND